MNAIPEEVIFAKEFIFSSETLIGKDGPAVEASDTSRMPGSFQNLDEKSIEYCFFTSRTRYYHDDHLT